MKNTRIYVRVFLVVVVVISTASCSQSAATSAPANIPAGKSTATIVPTMIPTITKVPTATLIQYTDTPAPAVKRLGVDIPIRIMPLGDSITEGVCDTKDNCQDFPVFMSPANGDGIAACGWAANYYNQKAVGYRAFLRDKIAARGLKMTYVGSVSVVEGLAHEGHTAWTITDLDYCVQNGNWLEKARPNVILLHIGTNDANKATTPEEMAGRLQALLTHIYDKLPDTTEVIVAQIIRTSTSALPLFASSSTLMNDIIAPYNQKIPDVVETLRAEINCVSYVDMTSVIRSDSELDSMVGLHPNPVASERMAEVWLAKILEVIGLQP